MTTPARKRALQWFHDRGEVRVYWQPDAPSSAMITKMVNDGEVEAVSISPWATVHRLTDKGRRALHGDDK